MAKSAKTRKMKVASQPIIVQTMSILLKYHVIDMSDVEAGAPEKKRRKRHRPRKNASNEEKSKNTSETLDLTVKHAETISEKAFTMIADIHAEENKAAPMCSIAGCIVYDTPLKQTAGTDWRMMLKIVDPSMSDAANGFRVVIFVPPHDKDRFLALQLKKGDIVMVRAARPAVHNGDVLVRVYPDHSNKVFFYAVDKPYSGEPDSGYRRFAYLRDWWIQQSQKLEEARAATQEGLGHINPAPSTTMKKIYSLKDIPYGKTEFFNYAGQVIDVSSIEGMKSIFILHLTDYTIADIQQHRPRFDLEEAAETSRFRHPTHPNIVIAEDMVFKVKIFDRFVTDAKNLKIQRGDWLFLTNLDAKLEALTGLIEGKLGEGQHGSRAAYSSIAKISSNALIQDILEYACGIL